MTAQVSSVGVAAEPHVFLIGRPPIQEYLAFVTERAIDGRDEDTRTLADAWRAANDHVLVLERAEAGIADDGAIGDLPPELTQLRERVLGDPLVQRSFPLTPIDVGMVELDRLVVHQKAINLAHVARLVPRIEAAGTPEDVFHFCLPLEDRFDPPTAFGGGAGGWTFKSPSDDFRLLGATVVDPTTIGGLDGITGVPTHVIAVGIGYGVNFLAAAHVEGRLLLWNGSHRAYALRAAGHTHVPCLIKRVTRRDELEAMGQPEISANMDRYLSAPRPPLLRDYFDEKLTLVAQCQRRVTQVQVGFTAGKAIVPE